MHGCNYYQLCNTNMRSERTSNSNLLVFFPFLHIQVHRLFCKKRKEKLQTASPQQHQTGTKITKRKSSNSEENMNTN